MIPVRWQVAVLLFTASVINYIDRQTLSVVAPVLTKELGISDIQYATILQAFLAAYTVMYVGSGLICDRFGTRSSLAFFMVWWSIANAMHGFVRSAFGLGTFRFLLGAGESGNFMASIKAVSEWYPPKEKAFANGLINAGAAVGAIIAAPLVVWITARFGWRAAFFITGAFGFVWLLFWLKTYYLPEEHPGISREELTYIREGRGPVTPTARQGLWASWRGLLGERETWGLMIARVISDPVWWFYLFWLPKYLVEQRGFTMTEMGLTSWMPYLAADLGSVAGGIASGWLLARTAWAPLKSRSVVMAISAALMPLSIVVGFTPSNVLALGLICLVTFAHMSWKTCLMTMTNDIFPPAVIGSVSGIVAFGSGLGATLFTGLAGWIVQNFGYTSIFVLMGFLHPISWFVVQALVRPNRTKARVEEQPDSVALKPAP
jgi:ACS family hexuronate transporter-like MFS transporter